MGLPNQEAAQSLSKPSEILPLCEDFQLIAPTPTCPPPTATPATVRDFLVEVMLTRGADLEDAHRVADKWRMGTGKELQSYPVGIFHEIFGVEDMWAVYRDVRVLFLVKEAKEKEAAKAVARAKMKEARYSGPKPRRIIAGVIRVLSLFEELEAEKEAEDQAKAKARAKEDGPAVPRVEQIILGLYLLVGSLCMFTASAFAERELNTGLLVLLGIFLAFFGICCLCDDVRAVTDHKKAVEVKVEQELKEFYERSLGPVQWRSSTSRPNT